MTSTCHVSDPSLPISIYVYIYSYPCVNHTRIASIPSSRFTRSMHRIRVRNRRCRVWSSSFLERDDTQWWNEEGEFWVCRACHLLKILALAAAIAVTHINFVNGQGVRSSRHDRAQILPQKPVKTDASGWSDRYFPRYGARLHGKRYDERINSQRRFPRQALQIRNWKRRKWNFLFPMANYVSLFASSTTRYLPRRFVLYAR